MELWSEMVFQTPCQKRMARKPTNCCPVAGIGLNFLTPSSPFRPLLHVLGLTDQQLQEYLTEGHSYGFILGHGRMLQFFWWRGTCLIFLTIGRPRLSSYRRPTCLRCLVSWTCTTMRHWRHVHRRVRRRSLDWRRAVRILVSSPTRSG